MNTILARTRKTEEGSSLFLVMTLIVIAFLMLASALSWSQNNALTIARNSQYWRTVAAAGARVSPWLALKGLPLLPTKVKPPGTVKADAGTSGIGFLA